MKGTWARGEPLAPTHCARRILRRVAEHLALRAHGSGDLASEAKASWLFALLADFERDCPIPPRHE